MLDRNDSGVRLTRFEVSLLLYAFDVLFRVSEQGKVVGVNGSDLPLGHPIWKARQEELQAVRDKLFASHEHER